MSWTWWHSFAAVGLLLSLMPVLGWIEVREEGPTAVSIQELGSTSPLTLWLQVDGCVPDLEAARQGELRRSPRLFVPLRGVGDPVDGPVSLVAAYPAIAPPAGAGPISVTGRRSWWSKPGRHELRELGVELEPGYTLVDVGAQPEVALPYASFLLCGFYWLVALPLALILRLGRRECFECQKLIPKEAEICSGCGLSPTDPALDG